MVLGAAGPVALGPNATTAGARTPRQRRTMPAVIVAPAVGPVKNSPLIPAAAAIDGLQRERPTDYRADFPSDS